MSLSYLPYAKQSVSEKDIENVAKALKGELITRGSYVVSFEKALAEYCGAKFAVAFNSATSALMATYFAAKLSPSDKVISSPNSFIATVGAPIQSNISPLFVDLDRSTGNFDITLLKKALGFKLSRGRLFVVPVHFSGIAMDMQALEKTLYSHPEAIIIEDAAHAIGTVYSSGKKVGSCERSHMTVFSFHPAKTMTTGEGGMVTTNDEELYHRLLLYRNNGIEKESPYLIDRKEGQPGYYEVQSVTGNFNFTDFQAALGLSQFENLERFIQKRRQLVELYRDLLKNEAQIQLFTDRYDQQTGFHLFVVQINFEYFRKNRVDVMKELHNRGIGTQVHYIPLYHHPVIKNRLKDPENSFPETEKYYSQALSLPLYYDLTEADVKRVCKELKRALTL